MMCATIRKALMGTLLSLSAITSFAQKDTLRVMAYNVLYYGNGCQGPNSYYHNYLKTITAFASPDILSLEKMGSIPVSPDDKYATAPQGFADSILQYALNAAFPGRYAYCTFTNGAKANNMAVVFYDQHKIGFSGIVSSYTNLTDFNTYKLYYKDPNLSRTHDTTFLYVIPNHDKSGDEYEAVRAQQIAGVVRELKKHFTKLPNVINLGDFNVRNSDEAFYKTLTAGNDSNFLFYDPPFYPDHVFKYPADWDHNGTFSSYFTTSTRSSGDIPNSCGSGGGAKNWYDHIFLSSWLVKGMNYMKYIPGSYKTIGNDGQRLKISINNSNVKPNSSAPAEVIEALYRMSNKYPVMISLEVSQNTGGTSPAEPEIAGVALYNKEEITVTNPVGDKMLLHFPEGMQSGEVTIECIDDAGIVQWKKEVKLKDADMSINCKLAAGVYTLRFSARHSIVNELKITKQ